METGFTDVEFKSGTTDANLLFFKGVCGVCIGICEGKDAHKPSEYLITDAMDKSIEKIGKIVFRAGQIEQG